MAVRKGQSFRQVAEEFGIKRSSLWRAVRKDGEGKKLASYSEMSQSRLIFTIEEEVELVQYLLTASRIGFPLDTATVKSLAYTLAIRNGNRVPDNWEKNKQAGKDWMTAFKSRHRQLSIRTPEATSIARATAFNKHNVGTFFEKLRRLYQEHTLTPERIYNVDETALTTSQRPQKVVAEAGVKQVAQLVSHKRGETVTMLGIINGIGNCLPPCLVFPRKNYKNHMLFGAPPGTQGFCNPSGWMTQEIVQCLHHIQKHIRCTVENKVLVILDNHVSHISVEAVDYCRDNGIVLLSLPPHCSHRLQPLDKTVFSPLKRQYNAAITSWMYNNPGKRQTIHDVAGILGTAYNRAFTIQNITSGFKSTGICPLDTEVFSEADFYQSYISDKPCQQSTTPIETSTQAAQNAAVDGPPDQSAADCPPDPSASRSPDPVLICSPEVIRPYPKATKCFKWQNARKIHERYALHQAANEAYEMRSA
ncbi:uncharacterized protein [Littorina saxatilis]|uniref:uncharacterized protein n=1 Tax=Littorina saxatilis TaxID=31220 RepID=UPI0038B5F64C